MAEPDFACGGNPPVEEILTIVTNVLSQVSNLASLLDVTHQFF